MKKGREGKERIAGGASRRQEAIWIEYTRIEGLTAYTIALHTYTHVGTPYLSHVHAAPDTSV